MKLSIAWSLAICTVLLTGCAHPIDVTPNTAGLDASAGAMTHPKTPAKVAYYIAPDLAKLEVTTSGGGGDNVRYYPYRAIEPGFQRMLTNVFGSAVKLDALPTAADLANKEISYLIVPTIVTTSGSTGFFTWPPTNFSVDLSSQVRSRDGSIISTPRVVGVGTAETKERLGDHGVAGRRAMADALTKMQTALLEVRLAPQGGQGPVPGPVAKTPSGAGSIEERLGRIKSVFDQGLLTKDEYDKKRKSILDEL